MKRLNRILSLALAAMMALTLLTGCGGKVTERAMEKAYGDYLRGQMGKPDMKVTYDVSPAVFEKIDADFRANKAKWFNSTGYLANRVASEYFYDSSADGVARPALGRRIGDARHPDQTARAPLRRQSSYRQPGEPAGAALRDRHAQADGADRGHSTCVDGDVQGVAERRSQRPHR